MPVVYLSNIEKKLLYDLVRDQVSMGTSDYSEAEQKAFQNLSYKLSGK